MGVNWINDVSGGADPNMIKLIAESSSKFVIMHNLGIPANPQQFINQEQNVNKQIINWFDAKLEQLLKLNVKKEQIIIDPGIGFGKLANQSINIIKQIDQFKQLDLPIMVGHSRKSFLKTFTNKDPKERDIETFMISSFLACKNVDYLRVHDVSGNIRAIKVALELCS